MSDKKFEITPEILEQLLTGKLTTDDRAVNYLIEQLIIAKQQYQKLLPQVKQKEDELQQLRKALNDYVVRFDSLQMDICKLWPN